MAEFDNRNRWALFRNERKSDDRDPDFTGTLNVDGQEFFIDGWRPKNREGKLVLSGRIKPKSVDKLLGRTPSREAPPLARGL